MQALLSEMTVIFQGHRHTQLFSESQLPSTLSPAWPLLAPESLGPRATHTFPREGGSGKPVLENEFFPLPPGHSSGLFQGRVATRQRYLKQRQDLTWFLWGSQGMYQLG